MDKDQFNRAVRNRVPANSRYNPSELSMKFSDADTKKITVVDVKRQINLNQKTNDSTRPYIPMSRALGKGNDYVKEEPERFVREGQESRRLIERVKDKIINYESFVNMVKGAWLSDGKGLSHLVYNMDDDDWRSLFNTPFIQEILAENRAGTYINYLMDKYSISRKKAVQIFRSIPKNKREKLIEDGIRHYEAPSLEFSRVAEKKRGEKLPSEILERITVNRKGKTYKKTKPLRWTKRQLSFLETNINEPVENITARYNLIFEKQRTIGSVRSRVKRLKKEKIK